MSEMRFNSQRDEIIPSFAPIRKLGTALFQFPTGWNSTKIGDFISVLVNCFNSQRDGILLCADPIMAQNTKF